MCCIVLKYSLHLCCKGEGIEKDSQSPESIAMNFKTLKP